MASDPIPIHDAGDFRIAPFRQVKERDVAGREHAFIAEGEVVLRVLSRSPLYRTRSLLIADNRVDRLGPLLAGFPPDVPLYTAGQEVMDAIAGFHIHRGILAAGERGAPPSPPALLDRLPKAAVVVVLFGVSNHDNVGGIFRNAAAFGADAVLIDGATCDPLYRKAIRVSVGGALVVPFARLGAGEDALDLLKARGFETFALTPAGATSISQVQPGARTALLLGAEGAGLSAAILARSQRARIPMAAGFDSLNVAVASGIALHHLRS